ncbi:MAG: hypothetical protein HQK61_05685, partial [Desulfamplus sp.]|nr:hypothetical protein [Desulfamplus sp.]
RLAYRNGRAALSTILEEAQNLPDMAESFVDFDWRLQRTMVTLSGNPVYGLMLNDFDRMFNMLGSHYFSLKIARDMSRNYYRNLKMVLDEADVSSDHTEDCCDQKEDQVADVVEKAMNEVVQLWRQGLIVKASD